VRCGRKRAFGCWRRLLRNGALNWRERIFELGLGRPGESEIDAREDYRKRDPSVECWA
jgi:hypothetical protein